jgi:predicted Fe-Mo cluster-binding NifX family protein
MERSEDFGLCRFVFFAHAFDDNAYTNDTIEKELTLMLIAVTAEAPALEGAVSETYENCRYLLIVETDNASFSAYENEGADSLTECIIEADCEAVITGSFHPDSFNKIADAMITRYNGQGCTVAEALEKMDRNTLDYIRFATPGETCGSGTGECNCGEDHD